MDHALSEVLGEFGQVISAHSIGGGCISEAYKVELRRDDDSAVTLFVKSNDGSFLDNFQCEALGLQQLAEVEAIQVPQVCLVTESHGKSWLVAQWIEQGRQGLGYFEQFGRQLAELHRKTLGHHYGWDRDNYLGAAKQINPASESWPEFFAESRIGFQVRWANDQNLLPANLKTDIEQIMARMPDLLAGREPKSSLLHGDLWSGNYLCDTDGQPAIIDPAVYRGCREAELGMLRLFGSCPPAFYEAYQDAFAMPAGWQRRVSVYVLYHLLNHLNLFGSGYLGQCRSLTAEILRI